MNNGERRKLRKLIVHRDGTRHFIDYNGKKKTYKPKEYVGEDIVSHESYESYYEEDEEENENEDIKKSPVKSKESREISPLK